MIYSFISSFSRREKIFVMLAGDAVFLNLGIFLSLFLDKKSFPILEVRQIPFIILGIFLFHFPVYIRLGLYRAVIRYIDEKLLLQAFYSVTLSCLLSGGYFLLALPELFSFTTLVVFWIVSLLYMISSRFLARGILNSFELKQESRERVAIYGAGRAGVQTARSLFSGKEYVPVIFFDDKKDLHGSMISGTPVVSPEKFEENWRKYQCKKLLLAIPSASFSRRKSLIEKFSALSIPLLIIPGMGQLIDGTIELEEIREVQIEDLLGRDSILPQKELLESCNSHKVILVTGAGGSIGSQLCRHLAETSPKLLILFEVSEFALYSIEKELREKFPHLKIKAILGDVCQEIQIEKVFSKYCVEVVYHAAAYKHVPLVEENPLAAFKNNILGTFILANVASKQARVEKFVLISTDKAVRPSNVMGATKRVAELIIQGLANKKESNCCFCMVRFGNVLGSSGSVIPLFRSQIKQGGPITVTHPEVTRYFMTIPEAAQLVIQAAAMAHGGDVFLLDMGAPLKIVELAEKMIKLSGLTLKNEENPLGDIEIQFVGLRPGEKLYEELLIEEKNSLPTKHPRIFKSEEYSLPWETLAENLKTIEGLCERQELNRNLITQVLLRMVPEYTPSSDAETLSPFSTSDNRPLVRRKVLFTHPD